MRVFLVIFIVLFLSSCTIRHGSVTYLEDGTCVDDIRHHTDVEWCKAELESYKEFLRKKEEDKLEEARELERQIISFDIYEIYELCMIWDNSYYSSEQHIWNRKMVAESFKRRGQDPLYCRNTSNSNDAARRSEDKANQAIINSNEAKRRAIQAEQQAYEAEQRAIAQRRRQQQQQQQQQQDNLCLYCTEDSH